MMSINLGTEGLQAARALRQNPDFERLREAIGDQAYALMNKSLDATPELRVEATAYARALRDLHVAIEGGAMELAQRQVPAPKGDLAAKGRARRGETEVITADPAAKAAGAITDGILT